MKLSDLKGSDAYIKNMAQSEKLYLICRQNKPNQESEVEKARLSIWELSFFFGKKKKRS